MSKFDKDFKRALANGVAIEGCAPKIVPVPHASEFITIPVAEYMYLQRVDALMDVLLLDSAYSSAHTIQAVKDAVLTMRVDGKAAGVE